MLAEIGHFFLILSLLSAGLLAVVPLLGVHFNHARLMASAKPLAFWMALCVALSYVALTLCFVNDEFSVVIVQQSSQIALPLIYKISAVWGGHEGSLLLWILILSIWTAAVAFFSKQLPEDMVARVLAVLGMITIGFLLFSLLTSNPFLRTLPFIPGNGNDLNPLLQDFGMAIHPPMLYVGYVGFSVAFAFAIAALLSGDIDPAWVRWTRPWTTAAWGFLTLGIALGSWWAYYELGWGGWWFWDPVENASFMPWLVGTALMHSLAVTEKRDLFKSWTLLLAIFTFSLCLLGTFLVRSGVLTSVHAFAADPDRGLFILGFLAVVIGGSLTLFALRAPVTYRSSGFQWASRELFLLLNNLLLVVASLVVLVGTLFPLVADFFELGKYSVGPPYFNQLFVPIMLILLALLGIGPVLSWKKTQRATWKPLLFIVLPIATLFCVLLTLLFSHEVSLSLIIASSMVGWLLSSMLFDLWGKLKKTQSMKQVKRKIGQLSLSYWAMQLAHLGLLFTALGVCIVSFHDDKRDVKLVPNQPITIQDYQFTLHSVDTIQGPNYQSDQGIIEVEHKGNVLGHLYPEKRYYDSQPNNPMTEAAIDATLLRDIFVALGDPLEKGAWSARVQVKPFLRFIWLGALMMFAAAALAVFDRRYRKV
ncbi:MAG: heme lyase CcmF/NrfE family subunit [Cellvibrionales bacterium]|nr:heme lyase CcmF/NrfE family subunit [Cellvibrionales bacterium]